MWVRPGRFLPGAGRAGVTLGRLLEPAATTMQAGAGAGGGAPAPVPALQLSGVPTTGTVGVAASGGTVTNTGTVSANWTVAAAAPDVTITPSTGTLAGGASAGFTLTATAAGVRSISLTSSTPSAVISGSPMPFTASAPPPPSTPTIFFGEHLTPAQAVVVGQPPQVARTAFMAAATAAEAWDFEGEFGGVVSNLPHAFFAAQAGLTVTATATAVDALEVMEAPGSGRFNTTPAGGIYIVFYDDMILNFSAGISAFGFYGTDWGDFNGQVKVTFTDMADVETTFDVPHSIPSTNGALIFWGFTHPGVLYKRVRFFCTYAVAPGPGAGDFFGVDDIIVGDAI